MEVAKLQVFGFDVFVDVANPVVWNDGSILFSGKIRHCNDTPIQVHSQSEEPLRLGYRLISIADSNVLIEHRVYFEDGSLSPGLDYEFDLAIPAALLEKLPAKIVVDFLYENIFWFSEHLSKEAPAFVIEHIASKPPLVHDSHSERGSADVTEQLSSVFHKYDFSNYNAIRDAFSLKPNSREIEIEADVLSSMNHQIGPSDVIPITELMFHFALTRRAGGTRGLTSRLSRFDLLRDMFGFLASIDRDGSRFIPDSTVKYLNDAPLSDGIFDVPMTRLMLWYWLAEGKSVRTQMRLDRESVFWWWVTSAMPSVSIPAAFVGNEALWYLGSAHEGYRSRSVPLTRFFSRAHAESNAVKERYDLSTETGLISYSFDTLIHNLDKPINCQFLGSSTIDFWSQSLTGDKRDPTAFEFGIALAGGDLRGDLIATPANEFRKLVRHTIVEKAHNTPAAWRSLFSQRTRDALERRMGRPRGTARDAVIDTVDIIGLTGSQSGLGLNAKMSKAALDSLGIRVNMVDSAGSSTAPTISHYGVSLFHVNADAVPSAILEGGGRTLQTGRRIGFFLWELNVIPESHRLGVSLVHEIWVPSEFLRDVYSQTTTVPVKNVGKYLLTPDLSRMPKKSPGRFVFLISFDFHSGVERKNPLAGLQAFCAAFPPHRRDVAIIIKTTEFVPNHWGDPYDQWLGIMELAKYDDRITVITDMLSDRRFFSLINECDCVLSPHRAEGFGYLPAYGLLLGKSVIVTNYSGTADYCTPETAWLVDYKSKTVRPGEFITDVAGAVWADIDFDDLVETMRNVVNQDSIRTDRERAGAALIRAKYSLDAQAARYRTALGSSCAHK